MRQPGPCVRALCEAVAVLLSKNMTCARPRCNATPSEDFLYTSYCALHTPHFTLQFTLHTSSHLKSCELFSPHLSSSHLIPSLLTCHLNKFFSTVFISSNTNHVHIHAANAIWIHSLQNTEEEPIDLETIQTATAAQEVPFIAGCSHFTGKNTRFRAPASSPTQAPCNVHAAITMHFAAWGG